jgi:hypothetical protein
MLDILFAGFALPSRFVKQLNKVREFSPTHSRRLSGELTNIVVEISCHDKFNLRLHL